MAAQLVGSDPPPPLSDTVRAAHLIRPSSPPAAKSGGDAAAQPTVALRILCGSCEAENPPGYRFCVTCGAPLKKLKAPPPPPANNVPPARADGPGDEVAMRQSPEKQGYAAPRPAPAEVDRAAPDGPRPGAGGDKIVGAPVLDIAATRLAPIRLVECARCHGHCVASTRFCKYCGAPLEHDRVTPVPVHMDGEAGGARPAAPAPMRAGNDITAEMGPLQPETRASTLLSSGETSLGVARSALPHAPLRSPSARPGVPPPDARAVRAPEGRLVVIVEDGSEGKTFPLSGRQLDVGRTEGDIVLDDDLYVSPRHARLTPQEGGWLLRDLGSVNRIYLRIRKPHTLRDADLLLLGLEVLQFQTVSDGERGLGHAIQHGTLLFGSPAMHRRARLCQKTVEGVTRDVYHLYRDETVIGRETGDIVFTSDPFLSRRHAVIRRSPATGEFTVADLDSSNGTYVAIREDVSLVNGDFVRIGQHLFRVDLS